MNSITPFDMRVAPTAVGTPLHDFVEKNAPALRNAAAVIGGRGAVQTVNRLFDDLSSKPSIGVHTQRRVDRLIRLFELDDAVVDDDFFLTIDPFDPIVEEICLLADSLRDASRRSQI
ncbi:MAG: hypothetical protein LC676_19265 [Loktanella sp.]|nr:hypothetical protein [Loktanella sp.]